MAGLSLALYGVGVVVAFGLRTVVHRRATGDSGLRRPQARPGEAAWWSQLLFGVALVGGLASPLTVLIGLVAPTVEHPLLNGAGIAVAMAGFALVVVSQTHMGASWRIGVEASERTELVTSGVFAQARNPIFTGMVAALWGLWAIAPAWPGLVAAVAMMIAVQLQVRQVEEPYLLATHGAAYRAYAARVGRFVPGLGRLQPPPARSQAQS
ncbi:isoprenylcysteine carboxylmethyltransferase family protein [Pseudonocardia halophobica]|uniref:Protein-S-isoprenylcysteine O-methyltransferase Ste14 n=2 Tax=Pseudonocardia halophobica TaxID=29401 RepID=A0A9W6KX55_9PSEU|nr:hypothetical protein GCM10017577_04630 [Pseudonocardia halophobica]